MEGMTDGDRRARLANIVYELEGCPAALIGAPCPAHPHHGDVRFLLAELERVEGDLFNQRERAEELKREVERRDEMLAYAKSEAEQLRRELEGVSSRSNGVSGGRCEFSFVIAGDSAQCVLPSGHAERHKMELAELITLNEQLTAARARVEELEQQLADRDFLLEHGALSARIQLDQWRQEARAEGWRMAREQAAQVVERWPGSVMDEGLSDAVARGIRALPDEPLGSAT